MTAPSRKWCFTLNNYTKEEELRLQRYNFLYICYGREISSTGTRHLQGVISLRGPQRLSFLKKIDSRAHWEICKNFDASVNYCKKDGDFYIRDDRRKRIAPFTPSAGEVSFALSDLSSPDWSLN